ncbi:FHA domain-containing protein [Rubinisphaera margarita]|uniref:FHA domain-containing protein n=1 Tax=Rubinisphaera margarita TaxID=2909586 RepID=UPI001EE7C6C8|nr:FHA domain-containing protein [Rubinisphaera margarita]MCG6154790.1 FHA domain-containing protein [Rubinisphaera margarita]
MHIELEVSNKRSNVKRLVIRERAIIGRQNHCDIRVVSGELSREHCRIEVDHDDAHLIDLGSTNGTYLNRKKLEAHQPYELSEGDTIQLGPAAFSVHIIHESESLQENETISSISDETLTGDLDSHVSGAHVGAGDETIPADEQHSVAESGFTEEELEELIDEDEDSDSFLAGVTSDNDMKTVDDDDDAYDKFLSDL